MSVPGIAVVVVTHQSASTIDACLERLRKAREVVQIRVVDNDSRDGTMAIVQRHALADARLHFIANPDNPGFAVACNQGALDSDAACIAFVNPDCLPEPDDLARLLAHARALPDDGLLGAVLVDAHGNEDGASRRRDPQFVRMLRERAARNLCVAEDPALAVQAVDAVSGAVMLMPRSLFARIGGFDEGYRLHAEDLDLCRRAREAGATVAVANDVRMLHLRGVSSRARPLFVEWHKHRGLWRYFRRFESAHVGAWRRIAVFAMIWLHFPLAALRRRFQP